MAVTLSVCALFAARAVLAQESGTFNVARAIPSGGSSETFTSDDVSGNFVDPIEPDEVYEEEEVPEDTEAPGLDEPKLSQQGNLIRICGCTNEQFDFEPVYDDVREYSDKFMSEGDTPSSLDLSNLVWAWGQFIDHDIVATVDLNNDTAQPYEIMLERESSGKTAAMTLFRLAADPAGKCRAPKVINTPQIDGGPVYGTTDAFLQETLRKPGSCKLRTSPGEFLPVTTKKDEKTGKHLLLAGDARVNEHGVLTAMHTIFMREHNRLCDAIAVSHPTLDADAAFEKARKIVAAKMQQITVEHFLPALGISRTSVEAYVPRITEPTISVEFQIAYRFGHDLIPNMVGSFRTKRLFDGERFLRIGCAQGSLSPDVANRKLDRLLRKAAMFRANEIDGKFSDALRNTLFGSFGEDLASRNLFRGRELGVPGYMDLSRCYGIEPDVQVGLQTDDAFLGLLREKNTMAGRAFGPTLSEIVTDQFHRLLFGKGGQWWEKDYTLYTDRYEDEIRAATLGSIIRANTNARVRGNGFRARF